MSIALPPDQPRHVFKSEILTAEEDLLLVELPCEQDLATLTSNGRGPPACACMSDNLALVLHSFRGAAVCELLQTAVNRCAAAPGHIRLRHAGS